MTADVARLLGEHQMRYEMYGDYGEHQWVECLCGSDYWVDTDADETTWRAHLAGVVAPLLERAAAEAAADVKAAVEKVCAAEEAHAETPHPVLLVEDVRAALADVPAQPAEAEAARLRERLNALRVEWYARRDARWNHGVEAGAIERCANDLGRALLDGGSK